MNKKSFKVPEIANYLKQLKEGHEFFQSFTDLQINFMIRVEEFHRKFLIDMNRSDLCPSSEKELYRIKINPAHLNL